MPSKCGKCGEPLGVGEWPFCPHGSPGVYYAAGDECDYVDHNLGKEPVRIRSWSERRALMKMRGLADAPWHPGSKTVKWDAAVDPKTMDNARVLLERAFKSGASYGEDDDGPVANIEVRDMPKDEVKQYLKGAQ